MLSYSKNLRDATRAIYAREAAFEAFGHRARCALDDPDFIDRAPDAAPPPADEFLDWLDLIGVGAIR